LYSKRGDNIEEILTWDLRQDRYFDPTFGGAVTPGWCGTPTCRNVVGSSIDLTAYAFLNGPRTYSPVVSTFRVHPLPRLVTEWRADFDPLHDTVVASAFSVGYAFRKVYGISIGQNSLRYDPVLEGEGQSVGGLVHLGRRQPPRLQRGRQCRLRPPRPHAPQRH